jgi:uncharacterized protein (DUF2141 family)
MRFLDRALSAKGLFAIALMGAGLMSGAVTAATLVISVSNIKTDVGSMNFAVFDNKDAWLGDDVVVKRSLVVVDEMNDGVIVTEFELEPGDYAVSVHHDDNDNGKMDTNFIGIPKEPIGLSNGAVAKFGPPKSTDAVLTISEDGAKMGIKLLD